MFIVRNWKCACLKADKWIHGLNMLVFIEKQQLFIALGHLAVAPPFFFKLPKSLEAMNDLFPTVFAFKGL